MVSRLIILIFVLLIAGLLATWYTGKPLEKIPRTGSFTAINTPFSLPTPTPPRILTPTKIPLPVLSGGEIFNAVNNYRSAKALPFLSVSDELCRLAEKRADYMMADKMAAFKKSETNSHPGLDELQYSGAGVGENLAGNVTSTSDTLRVWQTSPPHNQLLLSTMIEGTSIVKGCVATLVRDYGSIVVLLVGDK